MATSSISILRVPPLQPVSAHVAGEFPRVWLLLQCVQSSHQPALGLSHLPSQEPLVVAWPILEGDHTAGLMELIWLGDN